MAHHPKFHQMQPDPRKGGLTCIELGHDPDTCDDGIEYPTGPIVFTAQCLECEQPDPLMYESESQRDDEVYVHVNETGHRVAVGWAMKP